MFLNIYEQFLQLVVIIIKIIYWYAQRTYLNNIIVYREKYTYNFILKYYTYLTINEKWKIVGL